MSNTAFLKLYSKRILSTRQRLLLYFSVIVSLMMCTYCYLCIEQFICSMSMGISDNVPHVRILYAPETDERTVDADLSELKKNANVIQAGVGLYTKRKCDFVTYKDRYRIEQEDEFYRKTEDIEFVAYRDVKSPGDDIPINLRNVFSEQNLRRINEMGEKESPVQILLDPSEADFYWGLVSEPMTNYFSLGASDMGDVFYLEFSGSDDMKEPGTFANKPIVDSASSVTSDVDKSEESETAQPSLVNKDPGSGDSSNDAVSLPDGMQNATPKTDSETADSSPIPPAKRHVRFLTSGFYRCSPLELPSEVTDSAIGYCVYTTFDRFQRLHFPATHEGQLFTALNSTESCVWIIDICLKDRFDTDSVVARADSLKCVAKVVTWQDIYPKAVPFLYGIRLLAYGGATLILVLSIAAIAFIISQLITTKTRQLSVVYALGMETSQIRCLFVVCTARIVMISCIVGVTLGWLAGFASLDTWHSVIEKFCRVQTETLCGSYLVLLLLVLVYSCAAIVTAWYTTSQVTRVDPIVNLRNE